MVARPARTTGSVPRSSVHDEHRSAAQSMPVGRSAARARRTSPHAVPSDPSNAAGWRRRGEGRGAEAEGALDPGRGGVGLDQGVDQAGVVGVLGRRAVGDDARAGEADGGARPRRPARRPASRTTRRRRRSWGSRTRRPTAARPSAWSRAAAAVRAICTRLTMPSCMRAPPVDGAHDDREALVDRTAVGPHDPLAVGRAHRPAEHVEAALDEGVVRRCVPCSTDSGRGGVVAGEAERVAADQVGVPLRLEFVQGHLPTIAPREPSLPSRRRQARPRRP